MNHEWEKVTLPRPEGKLQKYRCSNCGQTVIVRKGSMVKTALLLQSFRGIVVRECAEAMVKRVHEA